ncbi:uncharacterized protein LOC143026099 [Oratosquilla oratoria]|uniref:uncharacterized protein LOC143026099 n=1 Tax=Oratosquilla oratoria TaxID=337810 RepID=UPI003F7686E0
MGSPISVILAEITMQQFENEILSAAPTSLKLWTRYVDDVFAILKARDVDGFLEHLNGKHEAIQFEMEKEAEGELPFLDVLVKRVGDILVTSVYRKATHTDRLLDFGSDHPICHKKSVVKTLWNRAERVCSTETSLTEERSRLRRVFRANGYPNHVVIRWTVPQRKETDLGETRTATTRISVPYVRGVSEVTARILNKNGVTIAHKPSNTLRGALTRVKDKILTV